VSGAFAANRRNQIAKLQTMIDYRTPPLGYLVRVPQESLDSSLDAYARDRAEDAARFLSFERIGHVVSSQNAAALETAEIIDNAGGNGERFEYGDPLSVELVAAYLKAVEKEPYVHSEPYVLVCDQALIAATVERLTGASVCGEIVAPGGIISVHREEEKIVVRARHMVLDFSFTDFVETVSSSAASVSSVVENAGS
jgi:phosphohistidine phosphatase SixA